MCKMDTDGMCVHECAGADPGEGNRGLIPPPPLLFKTTASTVTTPIIARVLLEISRTVNSTIV